ncbi:unnamed protein product [Ectocarpus sp. CCAP 1310/34]|nr:unnamed protein product [Ectocarpus sp. CCAP 1310/34]
MYNLLCVAAAALACLSTANAFGLGGGAARGACRVSHASKASSVTSVTRRSLVPPSMSTMEASGAADVLADLDELDSVMGVETQDQQDLKPKQAYLNKLAGQAAQLKWRKNDLDTGSPRIVVAILTEKIVYLTKHMQQHPHDYHSRRGLITMVNKRRRQLNYYFRKEPKECLEMCAALGIRFRPKTKVRGREQRYAAYTNTKSKIGNARRTAMLNKERVDHKQVLKEQKLASRRARGYDK